MLGRMAIITTLRLMLKKYTSGGDPHPVRTDFNAMIDALENSTAIFVEGATAERPAPDKRGRFFWDKTAKRLFYDDGVEWNDLNVNGGGGPGQKVIPGAAAAEGTSLRAARADHTHSQDVATATADGAMSKADKAKLDGATENATAGTLAKRDAAGKLSVAAPTAATQATPKNYVDDGIAAAVAAYAATVTTKYGPGLAVNRVEPLDFPNYACTGDIWTVDLVGWTIVFGNVAVKRTASPNWTVPGGNIGYTWLGYLIPTKYVDKRPGVEVAGILDTTFLSGEGQYESIQTMVQQTTGRFGVRGDTPAGTYWRTGGQVNVHFLYAIPTPA